MRRCRRYLGEHLENPFDQVGQDDVMINAEKFMERLERNSLQPNENQPPRKTRSRLASVDPAVIARTIAAMIERSR